MFFTQTPRHMRMHYISGLQRKPNRVHPKWQETRENCVCPTHQYKIQVIHILRLPKFLQGSITTFIYPWVQVSAHKKPKVAMEDHHHIDKLAADYIIRKKLGSKIHPCTFCRNPSGRPILPCVHTRIINSLHAQIPLNKLFGGDKMVQAVIVAGAAPHEAKDCLDKLVRILRETTPVAASDGSEPSPQLISVESLITFFLSRSDQYRGPLFYTWQVILPALRRMERKRKRVEKQSALEQHPKRAAYTHPVSFCFCSQCHFFLVRTSYPSQFYAGHAPLFSFCTA